MRVTSTNVQKLTPEALPGTIYVLVPQGRVQHDVHHISLRYYRHAPPRATPARPSSYISFVYVYTYVCIRMYVCIYLCIYLSMYLCMYVCMYVSIYLSIIQGRVEHRVHLLALLPRAGADLRCH